MTFPNYWATLESRVKGGKIDRDVRLTPEQFRRMQKQAYSVGYQQAVEDLRRNDETLNRVRNMFGMGGS